MGRGFSSASPWNDEEPGSSEFNLVPMVTSPQWTLPLDLLSATATPPGWLSQGPHEG